MQRLLVSREWIAAGEAAACEKDVGMVRGGEGARVRGCEWARSERRAASSEQQMEAASCRCRRACHACHAHACLLRHRPEPF